MFKAGKESGWTFNTSSNVSGGVSVGPVGGTGAAGTLVFNSPDRAVVEFHYMSLGASVGMGQSFNLSGSTRDSVVQVQQVVALNQDELSSNQQ